MERLSSLREERLGNESASWDGEHSSLHPSIPPSVPPSQLSRRTEGEKGRLEQLAGGLQSEASGLMAPSRTRLAASVCERFSLSEPENVNRFKGSSSELQRLNLKNPTRRELRAARGVGTAARGRQRSIMGNAGGERGYGGEGSEG